MVREVRTDRAISEQIYSQCSLLISEALLQYIFLLGYKIAHYMYHTAN